MDLIAGAHTKWQKQLDMILSTFWSVILSNCCY